MTFETGRGYIFNPPSLCAAAHDGCFSIYGALELVSSLSGHATAGEYLREAGGHGREIHIQDTGFGHSEPRKKSAPVQAQKLRPLKNKEPEAYVTQYGDTDTRIRGYNIFQK